MFPDLVGYIERGEIRPLLAATYPLEEFPEAQTGVHRQKRHVGNIVVTMDGGLMKITRITVYQKDLPLKDPYWLSGGRLRFDVLDATFVKLETDEGITGWGEGTPWGHTYVPAHGPGIRAGIETMAEGRFSGASRARSITSSERWISVCPAIPTPRRPSTWRAGTSRGRPPAFRSPDMLGGRDEEGTWIASSVSSGEPDYMLDIIQSYRDIGYKVHSAKVGGDIEKDIERIRHLERTPTSRTNAFSTT